MIILSYLIEGRAALISGHSRQSLSQNIPFSNRSITSSTTTASSPAFPTIEPNEQYLQVQSHAEQLSTTNSGPSTPSTSRHQSTYDKNELSRKGSSLKNIQ